MGHADVVRELLAAGADPNVIETYYRQTPLHKAAVEGHSEVVKELLTGGADPNAAGYMGRTPLHEAAEGGHPEVVRALLAYDADPLIRDRGGYTPLERARAREQQEAANDVINELLMEAAQMSPGRHWEPMFIHEESPEHGTR